MRAVLLSVLLCACASSDATSSFDVTATSDPSPAVAGEQVDWSLEVRRADDDSAVEGATVTVTPWMPAMGHGLADDVTVEELGGGLYGATCMFSMSGTWELQVHVDDDGTEGDAVVTVEID